jgi:hypothetical protein
MKCPVQLEISNAAALKKYFLSFNAQYSFYAFIKSMLKIAYSFSLKDIC